MTRFSVLVLLCFHLFLFNFIFFYFTFMYFGFCFVVVCLNVCLFFTRFSGDIPHKKETHTIGFSPFSDIFQLFNCPIFHQLMSENLFDQL